MTGDGSDVVVGVRTCCVQLLKYGANHLMTPKSPRVNRLCVCLCCMYAVPQDTFEIMPHF